MLNGGGFKKTFYCEKFKKYAKVESMMSPHQRKLIVCNDQLMAGLLHLHASPFLPVPRSFLMQILVIIARQIFSSITNIHRSNLSDFNENIAVC